MKKKGRGFYIAIATAGIVGLLAVSRVFAGGGGGGQVAVDTTGGTQGAPTASLPPAQSPTPKASTSATPRATQTAKTTPKPTATAPLKVVTIDGKQIPVNQGPVILLNPGLVRAGSKVAVDGFGFDPGATVDVLVKRDASDTGSGVALVKADQNGNLSGANFSVPDSIRGQFIVVAKQRNSAKVAQAQGATAGGTATAKLAKEVGKPGDSIAFSAQGFTPGEDVLVSLNQISGDPATKLKADGSGNLSQASFRLPVGAVGTNSVFFVGAKSQTVAVAQVYLLALYPQVSPSSYTVRAATPFGFSGTGFAPDEAVAVHLNSTGGEPLLTAKAGADGNFTSPGFVVPYKLKGPQTLIAIGEQSRAPASAGFQIQPYTPDAQPSTYGGRPGTSLSFYATGFGPNEVVLVYVGRTQNSAGKLVTAFRVDGKGNAAAAGSYMIPGDAQTGKLAFSMVGRQSEASATASVSVQKSDIPVQIPPQPEYVLPPELNDDTPATQTPGQTNKAPTAPPSASPSASGAPAKPSASATPQPFKSTAAHAPAEDASPWGSVIEGVKHLWKALTGTA